MIKPIWHFSVQSSNRGDTAIRQSIEDQIRKHIDVPIASFSCKHDKLTKDRVDQLNSESSMLIIGGSGLYSNYPLDSHWYFNCSPDLFSKITVPVVLWSVGCNDNLCSDRFGELTPLAIDSISKINEVSSLSSVRDYHTHILLKGHGITTEFCPDPALLLEPEQWDLPFDGPAIGINIGQHSPDLRVSLPNLEHCYYESLKDYEKRGFTIVFVAHDCLEHNIYRDLSKKFDNLVLVNEDNPKRMVYAYMNMDFTVGVKMHSNILSYASGTPFVSVYYDRKQLSLIDVLGQNRFNHASFVDLTPSILSEKIKHLVDNIVCERDTVWDQRGTLRDTGKDFAKRVVNLLESC